MLVFPQLITGAASLYPLTKQTSLRTVVNTLADGRTVVFSDPDAAETAWEMRAQGLTAAEWNAIQTLFQAVSGQWQTFTLLDPAGNLLEQSENFSSGAWTNGALLQLTPGATDPLGTTRATQVVNAGQAAEAVAQTLSVPGDFQYVLSVWARTNVGSTVTLAASTTGANALRNFALAAQWQRIALPVKLAQSTGTVTFGAQLDPGGSVDLFGMQVEAQLAPADYKKTAAAGGVYSKARFAADAFTVTAQSTDVYDAVVRIVSTES